LLTERQTDKNRQKHVPPPLLEVKKQHWITTHPAYSVTAFKIYA